jgi:hypothetical protein
MNRNIFLYLPQLNPSHINVNKTFIGRFDLLTRVFMNTFILSHNYRINSTLYIYTNYKIGICAVGSSCKKIIRILYFYKKIIVKIYVILNLR